MPNEPFLSEKKTIVAQHVRVSVELDSFRSHTYGASHVMTQRARRERVCIYPETRLTKVHLIIIIIILRNPTSSEIVTSSSSDVKDEIKMAS